MLQDQDHKTPFAYSAQRHQILKFYDRETHLCPYPTKPDYHPRRFQIAKQKIRPRPHNPLLTCSCRDRFSGDQNVHRTDTHIFTNNKRGSRMENEGILLLGLGFIRLENPDGEKGDAPKDHIPQTPKRPTNPPPPFIPPFFLTGIFLERT